MSVIVVGSINVDIVTHAERIPAPGETLIGSSYAMVLGGKGCNQAAAAARLGAPTRLLGRIGADSFGQFARERVEAFGVNTDSVSVAPDAATGIAVISIDATGQNCITVISGANATLTPDRLDMTALGDAKVMLAQMEIPVETTLAAARCVRGAGGMVVIDPAPAPEKPLPQELWKLADFVTPNETETLKLTGIEPVDAQSARAAAQRLLDMGVRHALVKMGAGGVYVRGEGIDTHLDAFKVKVVDTVAAGDSFNGALAYALAKGVAPLRAVHFASACGALACTKNGAADSVPTLAEAEALFGPLAG